MQKIHIRRGRIKDKKNLVSLLDEIVHMSKVGSLVSLLQQDGMDGIYLSHPSPNTHTQTHTDIQKHIQKHAHTCTRTHIHIPKRMYMRKASDGEFKTLFIDENMFITGGKLTFYWSIKKPLIGFSHSLQCDLLTVFKILPLEELRTLELKALILT